MTKEEIQEYINMSTGLATLVGNYSILMERTPNLFSVKVRDANEAMINQYLEKMNATLDEGHTAPIVKIS